MYSRDRRPRLGERSNLRPPVLVRAAEDAAGHLAQEELQASRADLVILAHDAVEDHLGVRRRPGVVPAVAPFGDHVEGGAEGAEQLRRQPRLLVEALEAEAAAVSDQLDRVVQ